MIRTVFGKKYFFCVEACQDGYREDRKAGLVYGPYQIEGKSVTASQFSLQTPRTCAYCGAQEGK